MQSRKERIQRIKAAPDVDVFILGAGINGIGTFRDCAFQGLSVVMTDHKDYCSGASAASSHMVHGGIRYLENGEFRLVREAVHERNRLIENAPHLVKPLPTTFPIFKWFSGLFNAPLKFLGLLDKPSERGAIVIKLGMMLYDLYTRKQKTVPPHVFRNRKASLAMMPDLNPAIIYTGTYYDGAMPSPERIAIELITDTLETNSNAVALNYVKLLSVDGNQVRLKDELTGQEFEISPKILVNACGPWIDLVNTTLGKETHYISATKGSHLILNNPALRQAVGDHELFFENKDGRIVLIYPMYDKVMIGTSDLRIDHPDDAVITDDEINYFFEMIGRVFPGIRCSMDQIVYTFSGVRPLQHSERGATGQISRDHVVKVDEPGQILEMPVFSLVGGKWTTFRAFSEHATDLLLAQLGMPRKNSTREMKIGGSQNYPVTLSEKVAFLQKIVQQYAIGLDGIEVLFTRYGTRIEKIAASQGAETGRSFTSIPEVYRGEIRYLIEHEDIQHLDDLIFRRTVLAKLGHIRKENLPEIAQICGEVLDWNEEQVSNEINRYEQIVQQQHKMAYQRYLSN